ncbi:Cell division protein FtsZ [Flavobacterium psychrophilum]|uniref:Cell division protein FtsZ n=1 Tax=Flavobacterium psychrophilum TaxID=96345 RepID=A0A7U2NH52_FLAPS|nr:cell division protein FtsZ [Flavobacterium psychrophilum]EKT4548575.1 cell division protein FtsZ [Flavobacterium psychrophilum]EKT4551820.1 cell division protein FtsZ [Flavobacterium psychrophilum]ELI6454163.1 cell division protein FtsZ [Flavobacterium psychrophilum]ELY1977960.1 cell division protein FtsZ [Flavobacterium psychrophilum]MBF2090912.1 cell division protein FtsZ [Flavobacterium psychrophilum]
MESNSEFGSISFDLPKNQSNVIKVIGVGGGGSNAINHMFKQGIKGVDFIVCNTDSQALDNSVVPNKIQLGVNLTEGLGAGANPEVGQQSAIESIAEIEKMLDGNTKMVFITAGMGGGTGTGAAPVIAQLARERDILTVGIVTIPFQFEGKVRIEQALLGVEKLRKQVDSLIVINNNKLREVYGNLGFKAGFSKADEVLATASRGIAEVITHHYTQNIDLKDAKTVLSNSGTAIMGSATAEGENRAKEAIVSALDSPLLNDNKIAGAKNVLLLIVSGTNEITIDEIGEINDYIQAEAGHSANIIMGVGEEEELGDKIAVTIIATGFCVEQQAEIVNIEPKKIIHALEDDQKIVRDLTQKYQAQGFDFSSNVITEPLKTLETPIAEEKIVFALEEELPNPVEAYFKMDLVPTTELIKNLDVTFEVVSSKAIDVNDFYFTSPPVKDTIDSELAKQIEVVDPQFLIKEQEQIAFTFDLPIQKTTQTANTDRLTFDLTTEIKDIKVNQAVEFVPMTEVTQNGVIKHSLEAYMEVENQLFEAKKAENVVVETIPTELNITMKQVETPKYSTPNTANEISPLEMSIEDSLRMRSEERRRKMKEFNYKFHNNASKVDEFEKEPAYKRMGIDISNNTIDNSRSRISLGTDGNDEIQLRSNNSFLHDNVD